MLRNHVEFVVNSYTFVTRIPAASLLQGQAFPLISQHSRGLAACPPWHKFTRRFRCTAPSRNRSTLLERMVLVRNCKQNQSSLVRVRVTESLCQGSEQQSQCVSLRGAVIAQVWLGLCWTSEWNSGILFYFILFWKVTVFIARVEAFMSRVLCLQRLCVSVCCAHKLKQVPEVTLISLCTLSPYAHCLLCKQQASVKALDRHHHHFIVS